MLKDTLMPSEGKARGLILSLCTPALLIAVLLVGTIAACGGGEDPTRDNAQPEATDTSATNPPASGQIARPQATEELEEETEAEPTRRGLFPSPGSQPGDTAGPEATDTPAVATAPPVLVPTSAETDREVLVALYNATDGENWRNSENWLSDAPLGEWEGVETDVDGRVTTLDLGGHRLTGEIPAELASLSNLENMILNYNELSGEIPAELGSLSNLEWLELGGNELSGEIPAELGSLSNLIVLFLYGNELSGEIPAELGSLSNLEWLYLGFNRLSGEIPAELGSLSNLSELTLNDNELRGEIPAELGSLSNLEVLRLAYNELSGCVPGSLEDQLDFSPGYSHLGRLPLC